MDDFNSGTELRRRCSRNRESGTEDLDKLPQTFRIGDLQVIQCTLVHPPSSVKETKTSNCISSVVSRGWGAGKDRNVAMVRIRK